MPSEINRIKSGPIKEQRREDLGVIDPRGWLDDPESASSLDRFPREVLSRLRAHGVDDEEKLRTLVKRMGLGALIEGGGFDGTWFEGLPWFLYDLRPAGFLGRLEGLRHRTLGLPPDIRHWTDAHVLRYLVEFGHDAPGALVVGESAWRRYLEDVASPRGVIEASEREHRYPELAADVLATGVVAALGEGAIDEVRLRVGALPAAPTGALRYQLAFNPAGLINEYAEPCEVLRAGRYATVEPLTEVEEVAWERWGPLEAFHTAGGSSSLPRRWEGRVQDLDYKTLRFPGH